MKKTLFYALGILMGCLLLASCNQPQQPETKAKPADDPRMAGFKGKIDKKYENSKEDWPVRPKAPAGAPNVLVILLDDAGFGHLGAYGGLSGTPNVVLYSMVALAAAPPVAAQGKDDLWEVSSKMEMPGMPIAMPAQVNRVCVGKNRKDEDLIPRQDNCRVVDSKRVGNRFTYKMECTGNDPSTIIGDLTFGNNAYDGQMRMTMTKTNDTMNMTLSGKRVGDCTAPAK